MKRNSSPPKTLTFEVGSQRTRFYQPPQIPLNDDEVASLLLASNGVNGGCVRFSGTRPVLSPHPVLIDWLENLRAGRLLGESPTFHTPSR